MFDNKIVLLMPAYNPGEKMVSLIGELKKDFQTIIVVNDGSDAKSQQYFDMIKNQVVLLSHAKNIGKGAALKTGFKYILEKHKDAYGVVTAGVDGQNSTLDILRCCKEFIEDKSVTVYGCRNFLEDDDISEETKIDNELTSHMLRLYSGIDISDTLTKLRVFPIKILNELMMVEGDRFDYDLNVIFRLSELNITIKEVLVDALRVEPPRKFLVKRIADRIRIYLVFLKFCMSSLVCYTVDLISFSVIKHFIYPFTPVWYIYLSTMIARVISGSLNYSVNRLVFKTKVDVGTAGKRFLILWFVQMCLSAFFVNAISNMSPYDPIVIKMIVDTLLFLASYQFQRKWVFKNKK